MKWSNTNALSSGRHIPPQTFKRFTASFDDLCRRVGRDPAEIVKATSLPVPTTDQAVKDVRTLAGNMIAAGIRSFVLFPPPGNDLAALQRFAREVVPAFR